MGNVVHGEYNTRLYRTWIGMKARCNNPNDKFYHRYGGRGIKVCPEWSKDFMTFKAWAYENGYTDKLTIDRKDSNGDYTPENCRWATQKEQANNRCNTTHITFEGVTWTASEWAEILGVSVQTIESRYRRNGTPYTNRQLVSRRA